MGLSVLPQSQNPFVILARIDRSLPLQAEIIDDVSHIIPDAIIRCVNLFALVRGAELQQIEACHLPSPFAFGLNPVADRIHCILG